MTDHASVVRPVHLVPERVHDWLHHRAAHAPEQPSSRRDSLNDPVALLITKMVGTMWCAYLFAALALVSLPQAIAGGVATLVAWIAQTFLQLVLLSIIMVGQKIAARASDKQSYQTYKDAEAILLMTDQLHTLVAQNNRMTAEIQELLARSAESRRGTRTLIRGGCRPARTSLGSSCRRC